MLVRNMTKKNNKNNNKIPAPFAWVMIRPTGPQHGAGTAFIRTAWPYGWKEGTHAHFAGQPWIQDTS